MIYSCALSHSGFAKLCCYFFIVDGQWRSLHWNICFEEHQEGKARNYQILTNWTFCPHMRVHLTERVRVGLLHL